MINVLAVGATLSILLSVCLSTIAHGLLSNSPIPEGTAQSQTGETLRVPDPQNALKVQISALLRSPGQIIFFTPGVSGARYPQICEFDYNSNQVCEQYDTSSIRAVRTFDRSEPALAWASDRNVCYVSGALHCEFTLKQTKSQVVGAKVTGKFSVPILAELSISRGYAYMWSAERGSTVRVLPGACVEYRVYLYREESWGMYRADFREPDGLWPWNTKFVGNHMISGYGDYSWRASTPSHVVRGWYPC